MQENKISDIENQISVSPREDPPRYSPLPSVLSDKEFKAEQKKLERKFKEEQKQLDQESKAKQQLLKQEARERYYRNHSDDTGGWCIGLLVIIPFLTLFGFLIALLVSHTNRVFQG